MAQSETEHGKACAALPEKPIWKTAALGCPGASLPIFWHLHLNPPPPCSSTDSSWQVSLIYTQCGRQENFGPREHIFQTFCNSALGIPSSWQLLSLSLAIRSNLTAKRFGGELWSACYFFFFFPLSHFSCSPESQESREIFCLFRWPGPIQTPGNGFLSWISIPAEPRLLPDIAPEGSSSLLAGWW